MKTLNLLILLASFTACTTPEKKETPEVETRVIVNDTIPAERSEVSKSPAATYTVPVPDELNKFEFSVRLYETPLRFQYRIDVRYKMMEVKDSVDLPNFGHQPKVDIKRLENDLSCMIGFYDAGGKFKELKRVEVVGNQVKIRQVKRYGLGTVKKEH